MEELLTSIILVLMMLGAIYAGYRAYTISQLEYKSDRCIEMTRINRRFALKRRVFEQHYRGSWTFDTKPKFDNPNNRESILTEYLVDNKAMFKNLDEMATRNLDTHREYRDALKALDHIDPMSGYTRHEAELLARRTLRFPTDFDLRFDMFYSSPQGRNNYRATFELDRCDIINRIDEIEANADTRSEYERFRDIERAKVSSGLRYDIFARDNYTCTYCGASPSVHGVTLHVDHIVPIKKGGLTVESNLTTSCRDCNLGKGTKD